MNYFENVSENSISNKVLTRFKGFEQFYYNIKTIINSNEFNSTGSHYINNTNDSFSFRRIIKNNNITVYVNSGTLCTTISLSKEYYQCIQCSSIVTRHKSNSSKSDDYVLNRNNSISKNNDDSSYINNPSNPSNPFF